MNSRLIAGVVALVAISGMGVPFALAEFGCYINEAASCFWFYEQEDWECPDILLDDEAPILAALGAPEGVDLTSTETCYMNILLRIPLWNEDRTYIYCYPTQVNMGASYEQAYGAECQ